jgi:hypothetical protein
VLWARVRALGDAGALEISGDPSAMRSALVSGEAIMQHLTSF